MIQQEQDKFRVILRPLLRLSAITLSLFGLLAFGKVHAAILYSGAANQDVYEGQTFVVDWFLDTEGKSINTVDLKLNFSKDTLEITNATAGNSLISLWLKSPSVDNISGRIELVGGIPNGAISDKLPIFRMTVRANTSGQAFINLDPSSVVLLNDGLGSNELLKFKNEAFNVYPKDFLPMQISSPSHPDPNIWYKNHDVVIKFNPKAGEDYSYSFSSNVEIVPDNQKLEVPDEIKYDGLPDGIYYFKLNSIVGPSNWKEAAVYRVQIDATAPEAFTPAIGSDPSVFEGKQFVSFSTVDKTSGMSHYKVKVGLFGRSTETQSPYKLSKPLIGDSVRITAVDEAGNTQTVLVAYQGYISTQVFEWILMALGLSAIGFYLRRDLLRILMRK